MCNIYICIYIYIYTIVYISKALLHVSMHLHHLQGVLSFYFAKVTKIIKFTNLIKSLDYNVHVIVVDDKIQCVKRCELSTSVIRIRGSCLLSGCICNSGCLVRVCVILLLLLPVCGFDDIKCCIYIYIYMCVCVCVCECECVVHRLVWIMPQVYFYVGHTLVMTMQRWIISY
jgi:hypothetical protein